MKFSPNCENVVFVGMRTLKSKAGKDFSVVTIADPISYENQEFIPEKPEDFSVCAPGEVIGIEVEIKGNFKTVYRTA